jgi:hypothetical protein
MKPFSWTRPCRFRLISLASAVCLGQRGPDLGVQDLVVGVLACRALGIIRVGGSDAQQSHRGHGQQFAHFHCGLPGSVFGNLAEVYAQRAQLAVEMRAFHAYTLGEQPDLAIAEHQLLQR